MKDIETAASEGMLATRVGESKPVAKPKDIVEQIYPKGARHE